jgi:hypothetical protein
MRRLRLQFRLSTLLWITLAVACALVATAGTWLGYKLHHKHEERAAISEIKRLGGGVMYDWQWPRGKVDGSPAGSTRLRKLLGDDFFSHVAAAGMPPSNARYRQIRLMINPEWLDDPNSPDPGALFRDAPVVDDDSLAVVAKLEDLEFLNLAWTDIGDKGLKYLTHLRHLRSLDLSYTNVSDAGVPELGAIPGLVEGRLKLEGTRVTDKGRDDLDKALPDCIILPIR